MKVSLSVLGLYAASVYATTSNPHLEHNTSPSTAFALPNSPKFSMYGPMSLQTCEPGSMCELSNVIGYCNARPSQQATVLGASQCVKALRSKRPEEPIHLVGTKTQRVEEYTSRDKSLQSVTTVVGVRSPHSLGTTTVTRLLLAKIVEGAVAGCRRPDCKGGRCPMSFVSAELDGNVEVWVWGEKDETEWEPAAKLGPSAGVMGGKANKNGHLDDHEIRPVKDL